MKNVNKIKLKDIAKHLNVTHSSVSLWLNGRNKPSLEQAFKIQEEFGIPAISWLDIKSFIQKNKEKFGSLKQLRKEPSKPSK